MYVKSENIFVPSYLKSYEKYSPVHPRYEGEAWAQGVLELSQFLVSISDDGLRMNMWAHMSHPKRTGTRTLLMPLPPTVTQLINKVTAKTIATAHELEIIEKR